MSLSLKPKPTRLLLALSAASILVAVPVSQAFDFGNMMNPNRWFGGDRDRHDERNDDPYWGAPAPYGPSPYSGYGYPGVYGAPYGMPYGAPGMSVPPAYGAAPVPGQIPGQTPSLAPASAPTAHSQPKVDPSEVEALKRRIEELEARQQPAAGPARPQQSPPPEWPSAPPAFRPMNQY